MRKLGISTQLLLLVAGCVGSTIAAAVFYHVTLTRVVAMSGRSQTSAVRELRAAYDLNDLLGKAESGVQSIVREKDIDALEALVANNTAGQAAVATQIDAYGADAADLRKQFDAWKVTAKAVVDQVLLGNTAEANQTFINKLMPQYEAATAEIGKLYTLVGQRVAENQASSEAQTKRLQRMALIGVGAASVVLLVGGILVRGRIVKPLRWSIDSLRVGSTEMNDTAGQVAGSAQRAAENASQQAMGLQKASTSLAQISDAVNAAAEGARKASELSAAARVASERGDQTTRTLDTTMTAINDSAAEVAKIIKIIEGIAFQTNLLALNASVEAARAGEAGRGFAVVAGEVRNLARRSADAARDTGELITQSVQRARDGATVASDVSKVLGAIRDSITQVDALLGDISVNSQRQAAEVANLREETSTLDGLTQQNAAGAEETASAAQELSSVAASMQEQLVGALVAVVEGGSRSTVPARRAA